MRLFTMLITAVRVLIPFLMSLFIFQFPIPYSLFRILVTSQLKWHILAAFYFFVNSDCVQHELSLQVKRNDRKCWYHHWC